MTEPRGASFKTYETYGPNITHDAEVPIELITTKKDGPWTKGVTNDGTSVFSVSICFSSKHLPQVRNVTMTGSKVSPFRVQSRQ